MKPREAFQLLDRVQRARLFKVIASAIILLTTAAAVSVYLVNVARERREAQFTTAPDTAPDQPGASATPEETAAFEQDKADRAHRRDIGEITARALNRMLAAQTDPTAVALGAAIAAALALGVVWLGQSLMVLLILIPLGAVAALLIRSGRPGYADAGRFIAGLGALGLSFVILMELLRVALSGPNPVIAIARNVVNEAVRIKVSLVFIVLLLFALAALPGLLDPTTPLRYRVQSFLTYGTGGSFWIVAILVLFLAVSSVAFEQRDRVIWQTMTKPVAAWQYILGKWLGVVGVAAVLLAVSSSGVFLFTEYLRSRTAVGEVAPFQPSDQRTLITPDRLVLESQVLTARASVKPQLPELDQKQLASEILRRIADARKADPEYKDNDETRDKLYNEYMEEQQKQYASVGGGKTKTFTFLGLGDAKAAAAAVTLRYKVDVGANDPKGAQHITLKFENAPESTLQVPLGQVMSIDVSPASIDSQGVLRLSVTNGDLAAMEAGEPGSARQETMSFPPDGLEVFYPVGGYHANFLRAMMVLWLKLAFLAMVAVAAATFLSFAVASLVSFGTFLIAESAQYLFNSLEYYASRDDKGNIDAFRVLVRLVAVPISRAFHFYSNLRPTAALVDGRLIGWDRVGLGFVILGLTTAALYLIAVLVFRRRELATYSGQ